jgi:hypothetical protein
LLALWRKRAFQTTSMNPRFLGVEFVLHNTRRCRELGKNCFDNN